MWFSRQSLEMVLSVSVRPVTLGKTNSDPSMSACASCKTSSARPLNGTRCASRAFMRLAGMVQVAVSRSTSCHCAPRTSPDRHAVRTKNSKASLVAW